MCAKTESQKKVDALQNSRGTRVHAKTFGAIQKYGAAMCVVCFVLFCSELNSDEHICNERTNGYNANSLMEGNGKYPAVNVLYLLFHGYVLGQNWFQETLFVRTIWGDMKINLSFIYTISSHSCSNIGPLANGSSQQPRSNLIDLWDFGSGRRPDKIND